MKGFYFKAGVILILVFISIGTFAQRSNGLAIEGKISVEAGEVEGAIIQMYRDGIRLDNYGVGASGDYKVELNYNHKFDLIFSANNNFSQKITVDTNVPKNILNSDPKFPPFPINVNLFNIIPGIDNSFSENTVLKIYYSLNVDNFISELYYNNAQIKKLIDQAILQSQIIGKEADYLSKLTRAEIAELRKEYDEMLNQAAIQYSNEQFLAALDGYKAASKIFPNEQFPKDRIAEINDLLGLIMVAEDLNKALAERFKTLISEADLAFNTKKYTEAKNAYNRALSINPNDKHAYDQINLINKLIKDIQVDEQYKDLISKGDNAFKEMLYNDAILRYEEALVLKQNEIYPKNQIEEIRNKLSQQEKDLEKQSNYKQAIFQAELMFEKQFYEKSVSSYQNALNYKPGDELATLKINEINNLIKNLSSRTLYEKFIKSADKAFNKKLYAEALTDYTEALTLFSDEKYPANKIDEINLLLNSKKAFNDFVSKANNLFDAKQLSEAKTNYQKALEIYPDDKHSLGRVAEIDLLIAQQGIDEQYDNLISEADNLLSGKLYPEAIGKYTEALGVKAMNYPKDKISEINVLLQQIVRTEQKYKETIAKADRLFENKDFLESRSTFEDAFKIKPIESYPPQMISKIDSLLAEQARILAEQKAAEEQRLAAETAAEQARIEAEAKLLDERYKGIIEEADKLISENDLVAAIGKFRQALDVKPKEQYPILKIEEIRGMISRLQEIRKVYDNAIAKGERELRTEDFESARIAFVEAKQTLPDELYPDEMIAKIDSTVAARLQLAADAAEAEESRLAAIEAEKNKNYNNAINKAEDLFSTEKYEEARNEYRIALNIKPEESLPQEKIAEIGNLLSQLSAAQKAYEDAITIGDRELRREGFDAAKIAYNDAKQALPEELYPVEMITKIDSIVETRARLVAEAAASEEARLAEIEAEKNLNYNNTIVKAEDLFKTENYEEARNKYRIALDIKPEEILPKQKIDEISDIIAANDFKQKELEFANKNYTNFIQQGDRLFAGKSFEQAKNNFQQATVLKPEEQYPIQKIAEIEGIFKQMQVDENYREIVLAADGLFKKETYVEAKEQYESAIAIKPKEQYPKEQIAKIEDIFRKEQEKVLAEKRAEEELQIRKNELNLMNQEIEEREIESEAELRSYYSEFIVRADAFFNDKQYNVSRGWYYKAWDVKRDETYPPQRISEINRIVNGMLSSQRELDYQRFINLADSTFRENELAVSRGWYNQALNIKGNEVYPKDQLNEIQKRIAERIAGQSGQLFESYKEKALKAVESRNLSVARFWYKKALELRPNDLDVKSKLSEIEEALK